MGSTSRTVKCIYGSTAQEIMERCNPDWCADHCGRISTKDGDCFWKFMEYGYDPESIKKSRTGVRLESKEITKCT